MSDRNNSPNSNGREKTPVNSKFKVPKIKNRNNFNKIKSAYHNLESENESLSEENNSSQKIPSIPPRKLSSDTRQSKTSTKTSNNQENSPISQARENQIRRDSIPESQISNSHLS